jgi:hypothetical protein
MQKIRIDFDNPGLPQHISAVENDSQSRFFQATLYENGKPYTAPAGASYSIMYSGFGPQNQGWYDTINDGAGKRAACAVSGNVVTCEIVRQALQVPGHVSIVLCVTAGNGYMLKSWPIECDCKNDRYDSTTEVESFFYITQISNADWTQAIQAVEELKNTIDPTLSLSGKAADAKATGDTVGELKEDITEYLVEYKEIPYVFQAGAINNSGYDSPNAANINTHARSTMIQMRTGDRIAISDSISCIVFKYDLKDRVFLSKEVHDNGVDIIFEQNTLIRLSIRRNDGGTISNSVGLGEIISGNFIDYIRENCKVLRKTPKNNLIAGKYFGELYAGGFDTNGIFAYYKKKLNTSTVVLYANTILTCSTEYKISYLALDKSPMVYDNVFANKLTIPSDGNYIVFVQKADSSIFDDDAIYDADIRISFPWNYFDPSQYISNTDFQNLKSGYGTPYTAKEDSVILETIQNRDENTVTLAVIADTHYSGSYDTRNQAYAINRIAERCGALAVIHLGDVINGINQLSANGYYLSMYWEEQLRTNIPILYTVAHHEQYGIDETSKYHNDPTALSQGQCIGYYGNQYKYLTHVLSDDKSNWYVDYENLRIIGLNSCDPNPISFSAATAQFLQNALDSANGKKIIAVSHAPANKKALGETVEIEGGSAIENALNSYSGKIIAYIHGHTHWDNIGTVDGNKFPYISICCAVPTKTPITDNYIKNSVGNPVSYDRVIGDYSEYCFDIINIHLDTNVVNMKRFGAGNDRSVY